MASQSIEIKIGDEVLNVDMEDISELLKKGLIQPYAQGQSQKGWRITEEGVEEIKKIKGLK